MRGRLLFALLFALGMWAALHLFSQTVEEQRTAAPMLSAVIQQTALPSEEKAQDTPQASARSVSPQRRMLLSRHLPCMHRCLTRLITVYSIRHSL